MGLPVIKIFFTVNTKSIQYVTKQQCSKLVYDKRLKNITLANSRKINKKCNRKQNLK